MRHEKGMETGRTTGHQERVTLRRLTKRDIDRRIAAIGAEIAQAFEGTSAETVEYLGQEIHPRLMNARRFIRIMSRYMSLN